MTTLHNVLLFFVGMLHSMRDRRVSLRQSPADILMVHIFLPVRLHSLYLVKSQIMPAVSAFISFAGSLVQMPLSHCCIYRWRGREMENVKRIIGEAERKDRGEKNCEILR